MPLRFGLFSINSDACSRPDGVGRTARAAETAGFDSVWGGEHVVLPDPQGPPSPMAPEDPILDPMIALAFVAAQTTRIRLGTGIIILPQRNPLVLAKELASLDVLSGGRLIFGIGVGYLEPEFRALGAPFEQRGRVTDDYLAAMRAIWSEPKPAHHGPFVSFANVQAHPQPLQQPHPPIVVGGRTAAAYRRAVTQGNGWYGFNMDVDATAQALAGLREAAQRHPRSAVLGELEISITPRGFELDVATAERYAAAGVHRLILRPPRGLDVPALERWVGATARLLIGRV